MTSKRLIARIAFVAMLALQLTLAWHAHIHPLDDRASLTSFQHNDHHHGGDRDDGTDCKLCHLSHLLHADLVFAAATIALIALFFRPVLPMTDAHKDSLLHRYYLARAPPILPV